MGRTRWPAPTSSPGTPCRSSRWTRPGRVSCTTTTMSSFTTRTTGTFWLPRTKSTWLSTTGVTTMPGTATAAQLCTRRRPPSRWRLCRRGARRWRRWDSNGRTSCSLTTRASRASRSWRSSGATLQVQGDTIIKEVEKDVKILEKEVEKDVLAVEQEVEKDVKTIEQEVEKDVKGIFGFAFGKK